MTEKEAKANSSAKIKNVQNLMRSLHLEQVVKTRINKDGFLEDVILWVDNEKYDIDRDIPTPETNVQEIPITDTKDETTDRGVPETPSSETAEETGV